MPAPAAASLFEPAPVPFTVLTAAAPFRPATAFATRPTTPLLLTVEAVLVAVAAAVLPLLLIIVVPALFVEEAVLAALGTRGYDTVAVVAVVRAAARVAVVAAVLPAIAAAVLPPRLERTDDAVAVPKGGAIVVVREVCFVLAVRVRVEAVVLALSLPLL